MANNWKPRIVETVDELTADWLTAALEPTGSLGGARVTEVEAVAIGTGQIAISTRLTLTYDRPTDAPETMVAKTGETDVAMRAALKRHLAYEREVSFYQELQPLLSVRTPKVYYADIDTDAYVFVLLMEDVAHANQGDQIAGCSVSLAAAAVDGLVGLHAPLWCDASLAERPWLYGDKERERRSRVDVMPTMWAGFKERYADWLSDDTVRAGEQFIAGLSGYVRADDQPWTVVHGDYRLDNMLIAPTPDGAHDITVLDWQTCTVGNAMLDVAYFIGGGLMPDDRRAHEERLVRDYFDKLVAAGIAGYSWDRCWTDYRRHTWAGLSVAIFASMQARRTERGDRMFMAMADRHAKHALDLDAASVSA
ncbi:phosphotransferase family protein [Mycolicibacterium sp. CBMA 226]|uniref:phosphotransferase family protein n=1 Tax=Mycolicibacterium sp. CBMA 226 TaxID=2606611 RepID=UPI0012DF2A75|nr:phosphotransferase [Mycolicibacterium sp. CBMA 226]MUL78735.1 phosphotransferase [Mycolicibacterium sp. CBMA 226]